MVEHVAGVLKLNSSKKYVPRIKDAVNPHRTFIFGDYNGICKVKHGFIGLNLYSCENSWNSINKSVLHLSADNPWPF